MSHVRSLACVLGLALASTAAFVPVSHAAASVATPDTVPGPTLPFIQSVFIHSRGDVTGPVCAQESVLVDVYGILPNPCWTVSRVELIPPPFGSPQPAPPTVRFVFDDRACSLFVCPTVTQPFREQVALPPLPEGGYNLRIETQHVTCDSAVTDRIPFAFFPFSVVPCEPITPCLLGDWVHPGGACDAVVTKTSAGQVTFTVASPVALAGLQGRFGLSSEAMQIVNIEPIGPASGMHLEWAREPNGGARFVLFAIRGAPIPPVVRDSTDSLPQRPVPILRLTVSQSVLRVVPPRVTYLYVSQLLGSDIKGGAVPECPTVVVRFAAPVARICFGNAACDFNGDGRSDIRDLVRMAHCVSSRRDSTGTPAPPSCPDSINFPDCNQDSQRTLADVICCAIHILRDSNCPDCPVDTTAVRDPAVRVVMGSPVVEGAGVRIPLTVENADRLGGALVSLRFPSSRYTATLEVPETNDWLQLQDINEDVATVGLVRLDADPVRHEFMSRSFVLHLRLKPGQHHGGEITISDVQFSSAEGATIEGGPVASATSVVGPAVVELSEPRPNPFVGETRFSVKLGTRGEASVSIFDLAGRRVALLHRGVLDAGTYEFAWRGTHDDGSLAPAGVFFYRATLAGHIASKRVVRLGN